ncbi:hypothetical protein ACKWTF_007251 [Chironomus riparius]
MEIDHDCTGNCKLSHHGNIISAALTKHDIEETKLIRYLVLTCKNYSKISDSNGRTALMIASSNAKPVVADFLLEHGANFQAKDFESNQTALHRALYYGWVENAIILKRYGASFDIFDADYLVPLQLIPYGSQYSVEQFAYVFGKNKNYNLGIGNTTSKQYPDALKSLPSMREASVNKFHSLFLSNDNKIFVCGVGKEGRLGIGNESTIVTPQEVSIKYNYKNERISSISAGLYHTLVRTQKAIYGCGSNQHFQLGMKTTDKVLTFTEISFDRTEINVLKMHTIIACDYHSVFANEQGVYVCGLNVGQFGGVQESIISPKKLSNPVPGHKDVKIEWAQSNNCCICVYSSNKEMNFFTVFYNKRVKSYKNPLMENFQQCAIIGGEMLYNSDEISKSSSQKPLSITILTQYKNLYIWYEDISQFVKVHLSPLFTTQIRDFLPCGDDLLIDADGQLFKASIQHKISKIYQLNSEYQEFHSKRDTAQFLASKMSLKRIQNVSNVNSFCCDVDGESFITIMNQRRVKVPELTTEAYDFTILLDDYQFEGSGIMDVTFMVKNTQFKANKFVVFSRCELLKNFIKHDTKNEICTIEDQRLTPEMFKCILIWVYKNNITSAEMNDVVRTASDENAKKRIAKDFHDIAVEWNLNGVYNLIVTHFSNFIKRPDKMTYKTFRWFLIDDLPDLYDVTILLDENQKLRAHKVVLMMRIEYFKMMFYHSWSENNTVDLKHISMSFMRPIVQYAYDNDVNALKKADFSENFVYNMIAICDQYLIENMKLIFETIVCERITLRNCAENLDFSFSYNCNVLKKYCMEFIALNFARLIEGNYLECLDSFILKELSLFYRKFFHFENDSNYIITPSYDAPTEEDIDEIIKDFNLESYCSSNQKGEKKTPKSKIRLSKTELTRRSYEKEAVKNLQKEIEESPIIEPMSPKSPDVSIDDGKSWQKKERERKDSYKNKKLLAAIKCNEVIKEEPVKEDPMIDLKNLKITDIIDLSIQRNAITLADFTVKVKAKNIPNVVTENPIQQQESIRVAWNMDNVELKPVNKEPIDVFKISSPSTSKQKAPKSSGNKKFTAIIKDEKKEKQIFEKIKSKSLILTQIEERAIQELSEFYNINNIFDESIKICRKIQPTSQNLSQWYSGHI